ncbi:hypothetical protein C1J03_04285 [Sulfitobacter sp. SK012]|uniref:tetratricopeptide repeat protein n=1 Tax=Sulfitobacter sp. SK012 TaxID=1389005 RepID=UPI000E0B2B3A|nr:tetratricopeptide repeat protein [Sulfitobacter sp. SK012]AXI45325.1 hypothetical protein C1J03_04285 [Sulfitobacter sp. SK012]
MHFLKKSTRIALVALGISFAVPAAAQSLAGDYLAARHAAARNDYGAAARYFSEALAQDPANAELMENAALSYLSLGLVDQAIPLAQALEETGQRSQGGRLILTAGLINAGDYAALQNREMDTQGIGPWVDGLVKAWSFIGSGDVPAALAVFDGLSAEAGMQGFVQYHKALALASVGQYAEAEALFAAGAPGRAANTRRGVMARTEILSQLGRNEDALIAIRQNFGDATDPELDTMIAKLEADETVPFTHITSARDGLAEVFFTFGAVLRSEQAGDYYTMLYARTARYLRPDHVDALLLTADLLESLGQYELAIEEYKAVPAGSPAYHAAELGRADGLRRLDKPTQAIEVLEQLTRSHGNLAVVHSTLGDLLRGQDDFDAAILSYNRALELTPEGARARWRLFYSRGIAEERSGNWTNSEADFRASLALNPNQPQVLNYLGYSLVEQNVKLDEALEMIERAVAAAPDSGYIVDSLGWAYYRLGRYEEAVVQMERAVELIAVDPVVNDHLGDVYWAVDRKREAQFQWSRALSLAKTPDTDSEVDPDRIRAKLADGLDKVLADEGAPPLKVADDK